MKRIHVKAKDGKEEPLNRIHSMPREEKGLMTHMHIKATDLKEDRLNLIHSMAKGEDGLMKRTRANGGKADHQKTVDLKARDLNNGLKPTDFLVKHTKVVMLKILRMMQKDGKVDCLQMVDRLQMEARVDILASGTLQVTPEMKGSAFHINRRGFRSRGPQDILQRESGQKVASMI